MTISPSPDAPVRAAAELTDRWRAVLEPPVFGARSMWLTWFGADGRQLPLVIPVDDLPLAPDAALLVGLRDVHESVVVDQLGGVGHLALALCRPGAAAVTGDDEAWAEALRHVLDEGSWSLHVAAGGEVRPLVAGPS
ncbi:hypothetical protein GCU60_18205 [Blastococcus saxobsidens]|uniref:Uncharacterized protein n=1 Tax=Blastococcus saxobsidens TaxID=138336 RepID=A0A6L9W6I4_9ACTN|nr:hypothetical protein [Blastococcus saxobsidens]NEK87675.1 hypothetical protein [Blastococcus saxobsidens]